MIPRRINRNRRTIYLAGPMRGKPLYNFPEFDRYARQLSSEGWDVISPAQMDRDAGFDPETSEPSQAFIREAISRDLQAIIDRCDAVALMPGWASSSGAMVEYHLAKFLGLSIVYLEAE